MENLPDFVLSIENIPDSFLCIANRSPSVDIYGKSPRFWEISHRCLLTVNNFEFIRKNLGDFITKDKIWEIFHRYLLSVIDFQYIRENLGDFQYIRQNLGDFP